MDIGLSENGQILDAQVTDTHVPNMKKLKDTLDENHSNAVSDMGTSESLVDEKQEALPGVVSAGTDKEPNVGEKYSVEGNQLPDNGISHQGNTMSESQGTEIDDSMCFVEDIEEDRDGDMEIDGDGNQFFVGDFVWGKIKTHPWWPGQVYNPLDASTYAGKYRRRERVLVAYFGDGTFAWCYPSQLKPFQRDFEVMSKQSNSRSFANAVEKALDGLGRCIESEMACSCIPVEAQTGLTRPLTVNAGIREGVTIPEGRIGELSINQFEPASFLLRLREIAEAVSIIDLLELTVLRSQLSAFYRSKGYGPLPVYHQPQEITDPEEDARKSQPCDEKGSDGQNGDLTHTPAEEDWLNSSGTDRKLGKNLFEKRPQISEDKLFQRKKKSMAELMGERIDTELETEGNDMVEEGKAGGKPALPSKRGRKPKNLRLLPAGMEHKDKSSGDLAKEGNVSGKSTSVRKRKKRNQITESPSPAEEKKIADAENGVEEGTVLSSPRIRKKSKYLSPPYTMLGGYKDFLSSSDTEMELSKDSKVFHVIETSSMNDAETEIPKMSHVEEPVNRTSGRLTGSPPILKCGGETFQKRGAKESRLGRKTPSGLSPRMPKESRKAPVLNMDNASVDKMVSELYLLALDCLHLHGSRFSDAVVGFFTKFRSSMYCQGSDYETHKKSMADSGHRERESQLPEHGSLEKKFGKAVQADLSVAGSGGRKRKSQPILHGSSEIASGELDVSVAGLRGRKRKSQLTELGSLDKVSGSTDVSVVVSGGRKRKLQSIGDVSSASGEADRPLADSGGRKRKPQFTEHVPSEKSPGNGDLTGDKSGRKKRKLKEEANLQNEKSGQSAKGKVGRPRRAVGSSGGQASRKEANRESPTALLLTFAPGIALPSKDNLIKAFSHYGDLKVSETEVLKESDSAWVVFMRRSDAEKAFNDNSERKGAFGQTIVSCQLRYPQVVSEALKINSGLHVPPIDGGGIVAPPFLATAGPPLKFIQENLEMMMSMLSKESAKEDAGSAEKLSPELRANLAGEIKGLLKKVATLGNSPAQP